MWLETANNMTSWKISWGVDFKSTLPKITQLSPSVYYLQMIDSTSPGPVTAGQKCHEYLDTQRIPLRGSLIWICFDYWLCLVGWFQPISPSRLITLTNWEERAITTTAKKSWSLVIPDQDFSALVAKPQTWVGLLIVDICWYSWVWITVPTWTKDDPHSPSIYFWFLFCLNFSPRYEESSLTDQPFAISIAISWGENTKASCCLTFAIWPSQLSFFCG